MLSEMSFGNILLVDRYAVDWLIGAWVNWFFGTSVGKAARRRNCKWTELIVGIKNHTSGLSGCQVEMRNIQLHLTQFLWLPIYRHQSYKIAEFEVKVPAATAGSLAPPKIMIGQFTQLSVVSSALLDELIHDRLLPEKLFPASKLNLFIFFGSLV